VSGYRTRAWWYSYISNLRLDIRAPPVCGSRGRTRRREGPKPGRLSLFI